jgi:N utilization substance protein B
MTDDPLRVLIVEARFYDDLADELLRGARDALTSQGAEVEVISVPGALEIPAVIAMAEEAGRSAGGRAFDGYVALGTVIRGETYHFEIVANESARGLTDLAVSRGPRHRQRHTDHRGRRSGLGPGARLAGRQGRRRRQGLPADDRRPSSALRPRPLSGARQPRSVARLAAVQALYQMETGGAGVEAVIREFSDHRFDRAMPAESGEGPMLAAADEPFFAQVVRGVVAQQVELDRAIARRLAKTWKLERLDATARAILRAGAFELTVLDDIPTEIVIDEYMEVAKAFFEGGEPSFINGALDGIARDVRQ